MRILPAAPKDLLAAIGATEEKSAVACKITLFVDASLQPEFLSYAKEAFRPQAENLTVCVTPYFEDSVRFEPDSDLTVILAAHSPITARVLNRARNEKAPAVIATLDPLKLQSLARESRQELTLAFLVTAANRGDIYEQLDRLFQELALWITRELSEKLLPVARALPFIRRSFANNVIQKTSLQNAAISAAVFLPGADMPLLTLNQVKMFLQIAAAYDASLDSQRFKEIGVLLLSGLGFRAIARKLSAKIPLLGWALRGGVGYSGTLAVGKAALEYFERGGDLKQLLAAAQQIAKGKATD